MVDPFQLFFFLLNHYRRIRHVDHLCGSSSSPRLSSQIPSNLVQYIAIDDIMLDSYVTNPWRLLSLPSDFAADRQHIIHARMSRDDAGRGTATRISERWDDVDAIKYTCVIRSTTR